MSAPADGGGRAFVDRDGRLVEADAAFRDATAAPDGVLPPPPAAPWAALGLVPEPASGVWSRGARRFRVEALAVGSGRVLRLEPLEDVQRAVEALSVASHDLRGPLSTARSYAALLASPRFGVEPRVRSGLEVLLRNVDRALALWEVLVETWRLDAGALSLDLRPVPLGPALARATETARAAAAARSVRLELDVPQGLPDVRADPDRLALLLDGVWSAVLDRSRPGAACGVGVRAGEREVQLGFWDTGAPLGLTDEARLLDWRAQAARRRELGPAVRLALAGRLVQAHGGSVSVERSNDRTLVLLTLPVA